MEARLKKACKASIEMVKRMNEAVKNSKKAEPSEVLISAPNQKKKSDTKTKDFLTKRVLTRATDKATKRISIEAMLLKGYVVQVENGWVIKIYCDGKKEKISRLNRTNTNKKVVLD